MLALYSWSGGEIDFRQAASSFSLLPDLGFDNASWNLFLVDCLLTGVDSSQDLAGVDATRKLAFVKRAGHVQITSF